jgi:hypothetical protein
MKEQKIICLIAALGLWLIAVPLTFGYGEHPVLFSDILSGLALIALSLLSLSSKRVWAGWAVALVGLWLQLAPLVFWAPMALMYINDTLVGAIAIVLSFQLGAKQEASNNDTIPTGWSYNPSAWSHRIPTIFLAMLCFFFSRYMAAFQLGYIDQMWDPFFTNGTLHVITSKISKDFPVSDAGLGCVCYTLEALLGWQGGKGRWASMPWLVALFCFLVIPVGIVSITLIILQPVAVGAWCSWCLATALSMLLMIVLTAGELAAVFQLLKEAKQQKNSLWKVFWKGVLPSSVKASKTPNPFCGITLPWNLGVSFLLGLWLMAAPGLLKLPEPLATINYILGPLVAACSVIACAEAFRSVRYFNLLCALGLIAAPWLTNPLGALPLIHNILIGVVLFALALLKKRLTQRYGVWERYIR